MTTPTKHFALEIARTYLTRDMAARGWVADQTEIVANGKSRWLPTLLYGRCVLIMDGRVTTVKHIDHLTAHPFDDVRDAVKFAEEWARSEETKMNQDHLIKIIVERLNSLKINHYNCDDPWYSCPLSSEGCANENAPHKCNCGASEQNAKIDAIIAFATEAAQ